MASSGADEYTCCVGNDSAAESDRAPARLGHQQNTKLINCRTATAAQAAVVFLYRPYTCADQFIRPAGDDSAAESDASSLSDYDTAADPMDRFSVTALPGADSQQAAVAPAAAAEREAEPVYGAQAQPRRASADSRRSEPASSVQQGLTLAEPGSPYRRLPLNQDLAVRPPCKMREGCRL